MQILLSVPLVGDQTAAFMDVRADLQMDEEHLQQRKRCFFYILELNSCMDNKDRIKDSIVDFIDDEAFYTFKKNKSEIEKGTLSIYIFATLSLLFYVMFLMMNSTSFDWFSFAINILVIIIYYCLAVFSNHEPYNAFVSTICIVGLVLLLDLFFSSQHTVKSIILKVVLIVYISMKLEVAKKVQAYNKANSNKS